MCLRLFLSTRRETKTTKPNKRDKISQQQTSLQKGETLNSETEEEAEAAFHKND